MTVRWGFIGAGWIAQRAMAPAVHQARNARLQAAASRNASASTLEPLTSHESYEVVIEDPGVDVIYVCLANHQHAEWVVRALSAGKHVLCEKPLALDRHQADVMAQAARDADRMLVEAVWCRWHPRFQRMAALAVGGTLGGVFSIDSTFTFPADIAGNYRADPECGGGALLDVGGYQVHAWVAMTNAVPEITVRRVDVTRDDTGIDLTTRFTAVIGQSTHGSALASFELPEDQSLVVTGSHAVARTGIGPAFTAWNEPSTLLIGEHEESFPPVDAYQLMVEAMSDRVLGTDAWVVPIEQSLRVAAVLDDVRALSR
jgi:predicted dehydrogenase